MGSFRYATTWTQQSFGTDDGLSKAQQRWINDGPIYRSTTFAKVGGENPDLGRDAIQYLLFTAPESHLLISPQADPALRLLISIIFFTCKAAVKQSFPSKAPYPRYAKDAPRYAQHDAVKMQCYFLEPHTLPPSCRSWFIVLNKSFSL